MLNHYISVSQLNSYIKNYLERDIFLNEIYVKGEISNFKKHPSGTLYFSIKDEKSKINVVMFSFYASRCSFSLKDGAFVLIRGKINVFEAAGNYQITAYEVLYDSVGMLTLQFARLKAKLDSEGLFDVNKKKLLPKFPNRIGIITAKTGAAIHDMVRTIRLRYPIAKVYLFPCLVQGANAANDIAEKIQIADQYQLDVLIVGRGGGSIEDLWPFNEEIVARTIFAAKTPIVSAVGHQSDFTIADFVADVRALTPTDAASKVTPDKNELLQYLLQIKSRLTFTIQKNLQFQKQKIHSLKSHAILQKPQNIYENYRLKLDHLEMILVKQELQLQTNASSHLREIKLKLYHQLENILLRKRHLFQQNCLKLDALSPLKALHRGYGMIQAKQKMITSIEQVEIQDEIMIQLHDGTIQAEVKDKVIRKWKN